MMPSILHRLLALEAVVPFEPPETSAKNWARIAAILREGQARADGDGDADAAARFCKMADVADQAGVEGGVFAQQALEWLRGLWLRARSSP